MIFVIVIGLFMAFCGLVACALCWMASDADEAAEHWR